MGNAKGPGGVPSMSVQADREDDGNTWGGKGVAISPGGSVSGSRGTTPYNGVHYEAAGDHSGKGGMPPHL